ncbi:hypothetical protein ACFLTH_09620 [Bacteroidota bacterium]
MVKDNEIQDQFESVYNDEGREELVEDDEISPEEEAFMAGYDSHEEKKKDEDEDDIYEKAFDEAESKKRK